MSKFWSPLVSGLVPYVPGEQPKLANLTKLNTNENPFPPSSAVLGAIQKAASPNLRRYPDALANDLRKEFSAQNNLSIDNIFVANLQFPSNL